MILRDTCSTSYDLASLFRGRRAKTNWHEAVSSALNFRFLKEVSQNCFVFDVVTFKIEETSQNCCVFDVAKFKIEEVLQNSFVFKLADRQIGR